MNRAKFFQVLGLSALPTVTRGAATAEMQVVEPKVRTAMIASASYYAPNKHNWDFIHSDISLKVGDTVIVHSGDMYIGDVGKLKKLSPPVWNNV